MYAGDFDSAIREQQASLELNPGFVQAAKGLALAQFASGKRDAALATWKRLEATDASASAEGLADVALYDGRLADARAILEKAVDADVAGKDSEGAARKLLMLAEADLAAGQAARAVALAERARGLSAEEMNLFYFGFCNRTLWPLFHYFPSFVSYDSDAWAQYRLVNERFADVVAETCAPGDLVWVHDYHLMLLPALVRARRPGVSISSASASSAGSSVKSWER